MEILGYGEDALTYWALTEKLAEFLKELKDETDPNEVLVIYRPSFGRGVGASKSDCSATFGEFDAIVATGEAVYLVESKWHRSPEVKKSKRCVKLKENQIRRHDVFHWYRSNLTKSRREAWARFDIDFGPEFKRRFIDLKLCLPPASSDLKKNLCFVLDKIEHYKETTINVVLFIGPVDWPQPNTVTDDQGKTIDFTIACIQFKGVQEGNDYFDMDHTPPKP